jgi:hypothetical protein
MFIDGIPVALTVTAGSNTGDWFGDITLRDNLTLGAIKHTSVAEYANGEIGYTRIYSRPMLQPEAQLNYQRGRKATASDTTGLVFNLPCTEGTGNPVDTVGSLTMTATGATWVEGLMDKSPNALALTSSGSPTWSNTGRTLAGTGWIDCTTNAVLRPASEVTLIAWVKVHNATGAGAYPRIAGCFADAGGGTYRGYGFLQSQNGTLLQAEIALTTGGLKQITIYNGGVITLDAWYQLALTYNGTAFTCYGQGVQKNTASYAADSPIYLTTNSFKIGKNFVANIFDGSVCEVSVYNRALTTQEITQSYNATKWRYGL